MELKKDSELREIEVVMEEIPDFWNEKIKLSLFDSIKQFMQPHLAFDLV